MSEDLIDRRQLDLICSECAGEVVEIFRDFVAEFPLHFAELRRLAAAGEPTAVARLAHRIKGSSSTFGLLRFAGQLRSLERGTEQGRLPDEPELAAIERTFADSIRQIQAYRAELA